MASESTTPLTASTATTTALPWIRSVKWEGKLDGKLVLIDQRKLPAEFTLVWITRASALIAQHTYDRKCFIPIIGDTNTCG
jgi:hypothetical protein